jgi:hypothetical protein
MEGNGMYTPKTFEQDLEKAKEEQIRIMGVTKDSNFEGSTIIKTENAEGRVIGYAIRQKEDGGLEGNKINYTPEGETGAVYQLYEADFVKLKQQGVLDSYEGALSAEKSKNVDNAKLAMLSMYMQGEQFDPAWNKYPEDSLIDSAQEALESLSSPDQEKMAIEFFNDTIGRDISNNKNAYKVYMMFKGTAFGQKFKQLEDARLKEAGFSGFTL